jgi:imidazolonepropionase-like amidohydrolase
MLAARTSLLVALALPTALPAQARSRTGRVVDSGTVIENVTLISPERAEPLAHAGVAIRDGRIAEVGAHLSAGPHATRIDGAGRYLVPGLIDSHVHVGHSAALDDDAIDAHPALWAAYRAQVPRAYLAFGFTSIVDLDLSPADQSWFAGTPLHPRFYSCGRGIKVAGGYGAFTVPSLSAPRFPNLVYEPSEAKHWPDSLRAADFTPQRAVGRAAAARSA